eukprot:CAMPEP_0196762500 /NCGR_PEP_ID=MMETSP1095-20130614/2133_1 /TAXON_ID=96789 ORGANISM="Chromulina nebulosa, Strain UTEXLB2642" /NCGR_SAMPLE_ID=MMETSP1095 /ASSEMBLY_ACC=CAM_ASM_000446 /LENGTH=342 /DNA_ID=CAMNT_0042113609 /DNA_START=200 /DNA_END=1228 /DNA_ORIENTATION=+
MSPIMTDFANAAVVDTKSSKSTSASSVGIDAIARDEELLNRVQSLRKRTISNDSPQSLEVELSKLGIKKIESQVKPADESALENAISNKNLAKAKVEILTKDVSELKNKLNSARVDIRKLQTQIDKNDIKLKSKLDYDLRRAIFDDNIDIKKSLGKIQFQVRGYESGIERDVKEIASLKKKISDDDKFILDKAKSVKDKRAAVEKAKKEDLERQAKKVASERAAALAKRVKVAETALVQAKSDQARAEADLKKTELKLSTINQNIKKEKEVEKKIQTEITSLENSLKRERDLLANEISKIDELAKKVSTTVVEIKSNNDLIKSKKLAVNDATTALKNLKNSK